jgi:hypothetical protein
MRTATVRLRVADFSREMAAMREWLDRNRQEPTKFTCDQDGDAVVVSVDFLKAEDAEEFARHFAGHEQQRSPPSIE